MNSIIPDQICYTLRQGKLLRSALIIDGERKGFGEWCKLKCIGRGTVTRRLIRGDQIKKAVFAPAETNIPKRVNSEAQRVFAQSISMRANKKAYNGNTDHLFNHNTRTPMKQTDDSIAAGKRRREIEVRMDNASLRCECAEVWA